MKRLAVVLVLVPAIVSGQRGGAGAGSSTPSRVRGEKDADWNRVMGDKPGIQLSNRDVEDMNPIKLIIDKRKDLKVTDDQLKGLKDVEAKLKEKNDPAFHALDSLRRAAQPPLHDPSDDDKTRMMSAHRTAFSVVGAIRDNYDASLKDALALLDETQRPKAVELTEKQRKDAEDTLKDKLGGSRGG